MPAYRNLQRSIRYGIMAYFDGKLLPCKPETSSSRPMKPRHKNSSMTARAL